MIEIIYKNHHGKWILSKSGQETTIYSLKGYMNSLLNMHITDLEGRLKASASVLNRRRNIPVWIDANKCFLVVPNHRFTMRTYIKYSLSKSF